MMKCHLMLPSPLAGKGIPTVSELGYVGEMGTILTVYTSFTKCGIIDW